MLKPLALVALLMSSGVALAQEAPPSDPAPLIDEARTAYGAGQYSTTRRALEKAIASVVLKEADAIRAILPAPFSGWTVEDEQATNMGLAALGGGITLSRTYTNADGSEVTIEIVSDSELVKAMAEMYSDANMLAATGFKAETIAGEQAVVDPSNGQIIFVIDKRTTFTVSGSSSPENRRAYAENIKFADFRALK